MTSPSARPANPSRAERFLSAFGAVESFLQRAVGVPGRYESCMQLARRYGAKGGLPEDQLATIASFATLRNAMSHGVRFEGRPIAGPVEFAVVEIEHLRDLVTRPPLALLVLEQPASGVALLGRDDPVLQALEYVAQFDYSQLPVYEGDTLVGSLTTNAIARWAADAVAGGGFVDGSAPVARVLEFAEVDDQAVLVHQNLSAVEAIRLLHSGGPEGRPGRALIATATGEDGSPPVAVIVPFDLPVLTRATSIYT